MGFEIARSGGSADIRPGVGHFADRAAANHLVKPFIVAPHALATARIDAPGLSDHLTQFLALVDRERLRFFGVHVLAVLHGFDRDGHVPVVRRPDEYRIDVGPRQHFAEITVHGAVVAAILVIDHPLGHLAVLADDIANGNDLYLREIHERAEIGPTLPTHADAGQANSLARCRRAIEAQGRTGNDGGSTRQCG